MDIRFFQLDGVKVLLETGPDSQENWDFPAGDDSSESTGVFMPTTVKLNRASIENLHLSYRESAADTPTRIAISRLEVDRQDREDVLSMKLQAEVNGQPAVLSGTTGRIVAIFERRSFPLQLTGELANAAVKIDGTIEDVLDLQGIDVDVRLSGNNFATLGPVLEVHLPETEHYDIAGNFKGKGDFLGLNVNGSLAGNSINITVNGSVGNLVNFSGVDLSLESSGKNLAVPRPIMGEGIYSTREFKVQGRLTGSAKSLRLSDAKAAARRGSLDFTASGSVKDLIAFEGMDLKASLAGKSFGEFGEVIGEKLPATDEFQIEGHLTGSPDAITLQKARGTANLGSMHVAVTGAVKHLPALDGLDLEARLKGKELAEIGSLFNKEIPGLGPFNVGFKLTGSAKAITLDEISAIIDKSDFTGRAKVEFAKRPKVTARLDSSSVDFSMLMDSLEQDERKSSEKIRPKNRFFTDAPLPLDVLETFDADILLKAENLHARNAHFESGHLKLKIEDSELKNGDFEAMYKETIISSGLVIDYGSPSRIATNLLIQNFDLGSFLKEIGMSNKVVATVDIATHLDSRGDSVRSLMANLNGSIGAVMGEGYLTEYLDMLSAGLTDQVLKFWRIPGDAGRQINCAVVQFDIEFGIATSRAFVFNSRAGVLKGHGRINLDTEKINYLLVPTPRHPDLSYMTNLRVSGTLMDPEVTPDRASVALRGSTALSALVVGPLGLLAPFVRLGAKNEHTCDVESIGELGLSEPAAE